MARRGAAPRHRRSVHPGSGLGIRESTEAGLMRVHFDFDVPLESPELCFMTWRDGALRRLALPPPGGSVPVPHQLGPMRR